MPVTIREVAKEAGVSLSTASRVIRKAGYVNKATREKVLQAIDKLQYHPDMSARRLKYGRTYSIGFVMNDIANPFFGHAVKGAERFLHEYGGQEYELVLFDTNGESYREVKAIETMLNKRVEGMIIASTASDECLEAIRKVVDIFQIPVVSIDNELGSGELGIVTADNYIGSYQLMQHLIVHHHHRRIGLIAGPRQESHARQRLAGCLSALQKARIDVPEHFLRYGNWSYDDGYRIVQEWLNSSDLPSAIFASNNFMCMGAISALRDRKCRIPQDIAIVSFDDMQFGHLIRPRLTVLEYSWQRIGEETTKLVLEGISSPAKRESPIQIKLPVQLVIRESCGCNNVAEEKVA